MQSQDSIQVCLSPKPKHLAILLFLSSTGQAHGRGSDHTRLRGWGEDGNAAVSAELRQTGCKASHLGFCPLAAGTLRPVFSAVSLSPAAKRLPALQLSFLFFFFFFLLRHSAYHHKGHRTIAPALLSMLPEAFACSLFHRSSLQLYCSNFIQQRIGNINPDLIIC